MSCLYRKCMFLAALFSMLCTACFVMPKNVFAVELVPVEPEIPFALIAQKNVLLYEKDPISQAFYPLTGLPETYFVNVIEVYNTEYLRVLYRDLEGYVKKSDVTIVDYEPVTKDALGKIVVTADVSAIYLRSRPDHLTENIQTEIRRNENLHYYGKLVGTSPDPNSGSDWYYVVTSEHQRGYVYGAYISASPIGDNVIEKVMREVTPAPNDPYEPGSIQTTPYLTAAMIAGLCIPAVIVMVLLFQKPVGRKRQPRF